MTGERGRRSATATSTPSPTRTTATAPALAAVRRTESSSAVGEVAGERAGPSPSALVTWLSPPVAASTPTRTSASATARRRERGDPRGRQAEPAEAHGQHRVADQEHDEAAAVGAEPVAADRDERQDGDRDAAGAEERGADEGGHEQQRLEQVVDPVEAAGLGRAER